MFTFLNRIMDWLVKVFLIIGISISLFLIIGAFCHNPHIPIGFQSWVDTLSVMQKIYLLLGGPIIGGFLACIAGGVAAVIVIHIIIGQILSKLGFH